VGRTELAIKLLEEAQEEVGDERVGFLLQLARAKVS